MQNNRQSLSLEPDKRGCGSLGTRVQATFKKFKRLFVILYVPGCFVVRLDLWATRDVRRHECSLLQNDYSEDYANGPLA